MRHERLSEGLPAAELVSFRGEAADDRKRKTSRDAQRPRALLRSQVRLWGEAGAGRPSVVVKPYPSQHDGLEEDEADQPEGALRHNDESL